MIITKIHFGTLLLISSSFFNLNLSSLFNFELKNDYKPFPVIDQEKTSLQKSIANGKEIYIDFCIQCHLANGKGDGKNFPTLDGSDWLTKKRIQSIHAVKFGQYGEIVVNSKKFNNAMPPMGLSNQEVADVMNYIMNSWSNKQSKIVTVEEVSKINK
jgi:mono/diheme cytochrome c family protein